MLGLLRPPSGTATGPFALRYPRDAVPDVPPPMAEIPAVPDGTWEVLRKGSEVAILARGDDGAAVARRGDRRWPREGFDITVVNCRFLKPYDELTLAALVADHRSLLVVEEGTVVNGFGAMIAAEVERLDPRCAWWRTACRTGSFPRHRARGNWRRRVSMPPASRTQVRALRESEALAG